MDRGLTDRKILCSDSGASSSGDPGLLAPLGLPIEFNTEGEFDRFVEDPARFDVSETKRECGMCDMPAWPQYIDVINRPSENTYVEMIVMSTIVITSWAWAIYSICEEVGVF